MKARLHKAADEELQAAAQWYEDQDNGLGERFLADAIDSFQAIELNPRQFAKPPYRTTRDVRRKILANFPYSIIYEIRDHEILVIAIAHLHRRPGYWRIRQKD